MPSTSEVLDRPKLLAWLGKEAIHFESRARETKLDERIPPLDRMVAEHNFRVRASQLRSVMEQIDAGTFNVAPVWPDPDENKTHV